MVRRKAPESEPMKELEKDPSMEPHLVWVSVQHLAQLKEQEWGQSTVHEKDSGKESRKEPKLA
jgi:hypothetical protein